MTACPRSHFHLSKTREHPKSSSPHWRSTFFTCLTTRLPLAGATTIACAEAAYEALHRRVGRRGTRTLLCGVDAIPVVEQKIAKAADSKSCAFDLVSVDMCVSNIHSYVPLTVR